MPFGDGVPVLYETPAAFQGRTYSIDGIEFNSRDIYGVEWWVPRGGDKGWFEGVATRAIRVERPARDGYFRSTAFKEGRTIELSGRLVAPSLQARDYAKERLAALCEDGELHTLVVTDYLGDGYPKQSEVELDGPILMRDINDQFVEFSLQLFAPDPVKYSAAGEQVNMGLPVAGGGIAFPLVFPLDFGVSSIGGAATIINQGNATVYPTIRLFGVLNGPVTVTNTTTGQSFTYAGIIGPSEYVDVNSNMRTVLAQGMESRRYLFSGTMFPLKPGANYITFSSTTSTDTGTLDVTWRHGWR